MSPNDSQSSDGLTVNAIGSRFETNWLIAYARSDSVGFCPDVACTGDRRCNTPPRISMLRDISAEASPPRPHPSSRNRSPVHHAPTQCGFGDEGASDNPSSLQSLRPMLGRTGSLEWQLAALHTSADRCGIIELHSGYTRLNRPATFASDSRACRSSSRSLLTSRPNLRNPTPEAPTQHVPCTQPRTRRFDPSRTSQGTMPLARPPLFSQAQRLRQHALLSQSQLAA